MKKKHLRMFRRLLAGAVVLTILVPVRAQVSNPSTWSDFVRGSGNPSVCDTFRMQTFNRRANDNWSYTLSGGANIPDGKRTLLIPIGGSISLPPVSVDGYQQVKMSFECGVDKMIVGDKAVAYYLSGNEYKSKSFYSPKKAGEYFKDSLFVLDDSPSSLKIAIVPAAGSKNGYCTIKDIFAFGQIPRYSLFTGSGNWNDTIRWSHLPPLRHRSALINGQATIDSSIECQSVALGGGKLTITPQGCLTVDTLLLSGTDYSLTVQGELTVRKNILYQYTFLKKGEWYFLSFPFDVYLKGIDSRFQLKDDTFSGSGDYIYVQTYNGGKRASSHKATGNWEVFRASSSGNPLVFEKGKGYLVALDDAASDHTLTFSASGGDIPADFGKAATIDITSSASALRDHGGWYLCGNPLPGPLSLSHISPNLALDGNIYLYKGKAYEAFSIGDNYLLPPAAAFFVKASADTELEVSGEPSSADAVLLSAGSSLRSTPAEPSYLSTHISSLQNNEQKSHLTGNTLNLDNLLSGGRVAVVDLTGRIIYYRDIPSGSSVLTLPLPPGLYIINIDTDSYSSQHKCVLTQ